MKNTRRLKLFLPILFVTLLCNYGCKKDDADSSDDFNTLSAQDQEAFTGMQTAFLNAKNYNDSLAYCTACPLSVLQYCDSLYHHYENLWYYHHSNYNHYNEHCDHNHGSNGNGMLEHMGDDHGHTYSQGHHEYHHHQMDSLHQAHVPYHP